MSTSDLIKSWYDEVWNKGNESFIDEMMDKKVIIHGLDPLGTTQGIESFKVFYKNFRESFPVIHIRINPLVHDENVATVYCQVTGRNISGKEVNFSGLCVARFKDGKLVEGWNHFDFLKMYQQLGHILEAKMEE
jgi:predicted ester cyclase